MSARVGTQTERFAVLIVFDTGHLMPNLCSVSLFRFPAVDHSRVKLENAENDYINASLVVVEEAQRRYILTQASIPQFTTLYLLQSMTPACEIGFFLLLEISISNSIVRMNCNYQPCANIIVCNTIIIVQT